MIVPPQFLQAATTFSEFGIYYFVFGLFVALGFVMLGLILVAEPSPQYDLDSLEDVAEAPEEKV